MRAVTARLLSWRLWVPRACALFFSGPALAQTCAASGGKWFCGNAPDENPSSARCVRVRAQVPGAVLRQRNESSLQLLQELRPCTRPIQGNRSTRFGRRAKSILLCGFRPSWFL